MGQCLEGHPASLKGDVLYVGALTKPGAWVPAASGFAFLAHS